MLSRRVMPIVLGNMAKPLRKPFQPARGLEARDLRQDRALRSAEHRVGEAHIGGFELVVALTCPPGCGPKPALDVTP